MNRAEKLRDDAAHFIRFSRYISNPLDIAHFEARAAEATRAADEIELADAAQLSGGRAAAE